MVKEGLVYVITAPSGTGKTTICRKLLEIEENLWYSVSATTRPPRPGEINGVHYIFMSKEEFIRKIKEDYFLEWAEVYGEYYGTPKVQVLNKLMSGIDVVMDIDVQGAFNVKRALREKVVTIFLIPPSIEELKKRLKKRGPQKDLELRLNEALKEVTFASAFDYLVVNDILEKTVDEIRSIIKSEKLRFFRNWWYLDKFIKDGRI